MGQSRPTKTKRLTREDWANAALKAISKQGLSGVAVEPIAKELGVTKGSFYWHFKTRNELIEAAVEHWEVLGDLAIIETVSAHTEPRAQLRALFNAAFDKKNAHALLHHLASSQTHPCISPVLHRVTEKRIQALTQMYTGCGLSVADAHHRALLAYATYVGMFQLRATAPKSTPTPPEQQAFTRHLVETLVPAPLEGHVQHPVG
jgi:AcrR family transcriptional regulator